MRRYHQGIRQLEDGHWVVYESSKHGEAIRGHFASRREAEARLATYQKANSVDYVMHQGQRLLIESIEGLVAPKPKYWFGPVAPCDDFGSPIDDTFIDGATLQGPWAIMTPATWRYKGRGLGTGLGQRYDRQPDGRWLKTEG